MADVEYAHAEDGTNIAYQVLAASTDSGAPGTADLVMVSGGMFPMEVFDQERGFARLLDGLQSMGRVVVFDRRGIGQSDPIFDWDRPIIDQWADDLATVVDPTEIGEAVIFAWDGFGIATRFAAEHAPRVRSLVLFHPLMTTDDEWETWRADRFGQVQENLGGGHHQFLELIAPSSAGDAAFRDWYTRAGRTGASPATAARIWESVFRSHPRDQRLPEVTTTTLVMHRLGNRYIPPELVVGVAEQLGNAKVAALDGADHFPFNGDVDSVIAEIADFVVGERRLPPPERTLAAVMFTDLVASTERAASLGDDRWKAVLDRHDAIIRNTVGRCGGTVVKNTGDGILAVFPSAGVAVRAAARVRTDLADDGLTVRIGLHVGDVDRRGDDISGLAVHIAARVMASAAAGEIVVTQSVQVALAGQGTDFEPHGTQSLKGVPGEWVLFKLVDS